MRMDFEEKIRVRDIDADEIIEALADAAEKGDIGRNEIRKLYWVVRDLLYQGEIKGREARKLLRLLQEIIDEIGSEYEDDEDDEDDNDDDGNDNDDGRIIMSSGPPMDDGPIMV